MPNQRLVLEKLDGGLNLSNPEGLANEQAQASENVDYSQILGGFVTRKGSVALSAALGSSITSALKLYNANGSYRYTQAGTTQFRNFVSFKTGLAAQRISGAPFREQHFFSDGTSLWADDGTSASGYPWGIQPPASAVLVAAGPVPTTAVAHFDNTGTNSESWTSVAGSQTFDAAVKKEGNQSLSITQDAVSLRGASTLSFATASNFAVNAGANVQMQGYFQIWIYLWDPNWLQSLDLKIDVGNGLFDQDYYTYHTDRNIIPQQVTEIQDRVAYRPDIGLQAARPMIARNQMSGAQTPRNLFPAIQSGWQQLTIPLTQFLRTGNTTGRDLSTSVALMVAFTGNTPGSALTLKFDGWNLIGHAQTLNVGDYYYYETWQHLDASGNLLNESNPSPISAVFRNPGGLAVLTSTNTIVASFVTHRGFYRIGGNLDQPYQIGTMAYAAGTATFTDSMADIDALYGNIPLATDNNPAPRNYYWIDGPHFDRIFAGSGINLRWTKVNMPHSWPGTNTSPLPGAQAGDTIGRIIRFYNQLYVYTYTTVYVLSGSSENDFALTQTFSQTGTPAGWTVVNAGNRMLYVGGQGHIPFGIYAHDGLYDHLLTFEKLEPFFTGRTGAGGILPLNGAYVSKCSAAWHRNSYWLAYPSGTSTIPDRLLRIDLSHEQASVPITIYKYSSPAQITVLDLETIDGILVAGGGDGILYQLESGYTDAGSQLAWNWQSKDFPISQKFDQNPLWQVGIDMNSQGQGVAVQPFYDNSVYTPGAIGTASTAKRDWCTDVKGETTEVPRRNVSVRLSGTASNEVQIYGLKIDTVRLQ